MDRYIVKFLLKESRDTSYIIHESTVEADSMEEAIKMVAYEILDKEVRMFIHETWEPISVVREKDIKILRMLEEVY